MRTSSFRWLSLPLGLVLLACSGSEGPLDPPVRVPAALSLVSGNDQEGKAGEDLGEPFVVRVTDARGAGVDKVHVWWRVASGAGFFLSESDNFYKPTLSTRTDSDGVTRVLFRPTVLAPTSVTVSVVGLEGLPVVFTIDATVLVIKIGVPWSGGWRFSGPDGSNQVTVPVGTTVEWVSSHYGEHGILSSSTPPGGASFDSGTLNPGARFQFIPDVAGTWDYICEIHGSDESGTITAF